MRTVDRTYNIHFKSRCSYDIGYMTYESPSDVIGPVCLGYVPFAQRKSYNSLFSSDGALKADIFFEEFSRALRRRGFVMNVILHKKFPGYS